jgi:O-acetyl-ADP-ribose deacetylase (regulator of RNase III)
MLPTHLVACRVDITTVEVDAIVNAANTRLAPGGGVCGAIHRAAGPELAQACAALGHCPTGEARLTPGFNLKAKHVIHAERVIFACFDDATLDMYRRCGVAVDERIAY